MKKTVLFILFIISASFVFAQNIKPVVTGPVLQYHGKRIPGNDDNFSVKEINLSENGSSVTVFFSSPVDPRSISSDKIILNGKTLGKAIKCEYNRAGDMVRIPLNEKVSKKFSISLKGIKNFNGSELKEFYFEELIPGKNIF